MLPAEWNLFDQMIKYIFPKAPIHNLNTTTHLQKEMKLKFLEKE